MPCSIPPHPGLGLSMGKLPAQDSGLNVISGTLSDHQAVVPEVCGMVRPICALA
jgi:hypothetical protein